VQGMLKQPLGMDKEPEAMALKDFLVLLHERFKVPIRIDVAAFSRIGIQGAVQMYDREVKLPVVRGMTLGDALRDALAQLEPAAGENQSVRPMTFRVRNGQILIVPAFQPTILSVGGGPGGPGGEADVANMTREQSLEQDEGEPITLAVEEKPLSEVLRELRHTTGANIVLDARQKEKAKLEVSATLHDVRLMAALRVLGDMCELQPVALNNVFYVTSKENAERLQKEIDRRRYGEPQQLGGVGGLGGWGLGGPGYGGYGGPGLGGPGAGAGGVVGGGGAGGAIPPPMPTPPAKPKTDKGM
jgi:hypothetical protein